MYRLRAFSMLFSPDGAVCNLTNPVRQISHFSHTRLARVDKAESICYSLPMLATPTEQQQLVDFFHTGVQHTYVKMSISPDRTKPRGVFFI